MGILIRSFFEGDNLGGVLGSMFKRDIYDEHFDNFIFQQHFSGGVSDNYATVLL